MLQTLQEILSLQLNPLCPFLQPLQSLQQDQQTLLLLELLSDLEVQFLQLLRIHPDHRWLPQTHWVRWLQDLRLNPWLLESLRPRDFREYQWLPLDPSLLTLQSVPLAR